MIERTDPLFGPRLDADGELGGTLEPAAHRDHAAGRVSISDALRVGAARALAATWATPSMMVFPLGTPTLPPATHTNAIFVVSGADAVLIEPGSPREEENARLVATVRELERRGVRVKEIWATHHHADHVGGARAITDALGLPLRAHQETLDRLGDDVARGAPIAEGDVLRVGELALQALHVPGHAAGHLVFFDPALGALVAGDMVAAVGTILIEPGDGDMARYLDSLRRLAALDATVVIPAHGGAIRPGRAIFEHYVAHRLAREEKVLASLEHTAQPLNVLVARAYADTPPAIWPLALLSLEAHLLKLRAEGRASFGPSGWSRT